MIHKLRLNFLSSAAMLHLSLNKMVRNYYSYTEMESGKRNADMAEFNCVPLLSVHSIEIKLVFARLF